MKSFYLELARPQEQKHSLGIRFGRLTAYWSSAYLLLICSAGYLRIKLILQRCLKSPAFCHPVVLPLELLITQRSEEPLMIDDKYLSGSLSDLLSFFFLSSSMSPSWTPAACDDQLCQAVWWTLLVPGCQLFTITAYIYTYSLLCFLEVFLISFKNANHI